jgi:anti-anti-sigma factor
MSTHPRLHWLDREDIDDVTVARFLVTRLWGEELCREVFGLLFGLVDQAGRSRIVLNLERVELMDSSAISKVVLLNHKVQAAGGRLALCRLQPRVDDLFKTMHLTGTVAIYAEEKEALESFPPPSMSP